MTAGRDDFMRLRDNIWRVITDPRYPDPLRRKKGELRILLSCVVLGSIILVAYYLSPFQTRWMAARVSLPEMVYQSYTPVPSLETAELVVKRLSGLANWRIGWMATAFSVGMLSCIGRFQRWKFGFVGISMLLFASGYLEVQSIDSFQVGLLSHWGTQLSETSFQALSRTVYFHGVWKLVALVFGGVLAVGFFMKWMRSIFQN